MQILWDNDKNNLLKRERGLSFEEVAELLLSRDYLDILENPARREQMIFIVRIRDYVHAVPFVVDDKGNIILKTVFPSRKFNRLYGGGGSDENENG